VLLAGVTNVVINPLGDTDDANIVVRLTPTGVIDTSYGTNGIASDVSLTTGSYHPWRLTSTFFRRDTGEVEFTGWLGYTDPNYTGQIVRFAPDGKSTTTQDLTAASSLGTVYLGGTPLPSTGTALTADVIVSSNHAVTHTFAVTRDDGVTLSSIPLRPGGLAATTDGDVLITANRNHHHSVLMRLTPAGVLDPSFGTGGIVDLAVSASRRGVAAPDAKIGAVAQLPDGTYIATGAYGNQLLLARFDAV
jgi:hypothetical protein